jgi:hypothetical protein
LEVVNLQLPEWSDSDETPWRVLNHLLPLISTVNSIRIIYGDVFLYEEYLDEYTMKKYSQMVTTILAQTRILEIRFKQKKHNCLMQIAQISGHKTYLIKKKLF